MPPLYPDAETIAGMIDALTDDETTEAARYVLRLARGRMLADAKVIAAYENQMARLRWVAIRLTRDAGERAADRRE